MKLIKFAGAAMITVSLLLSAPLSATTAHAAASTQSSPIWHPLDTVNKPYKQNGVLFVPLREVAQGLYVQLTFPAKNQLYIHGPSQSVRVTIGQSKAIDAKGNILKLEAAPVVKKGVTYVPASLLTKAFGAKFKYSAASGLSTTLNFASGYTFASAGNMLFWLNLDKGTLFMGEAGSIPTQAGRIQMENVDILSVQARQINSSTYAADIINFYGEPHIHEGRYRVLIQDNKIPKQSTLLAKWSSPHLVDIKKNT
ncbi:hypothetical protein JCM10914A_20650 [Paenibacillus sp. JCM 10914]|uniref:copper amine oxidase N-terminal domain-containing protein n=1 Tax=Paenibacillus sp. JCM 10914 TaxID=1236974 RepID=UPI0003CC48A9|nr:copper amine oxidase N-terminal domain-containing protein [Paenibacillus sp. JCM 10914]GAE09283.1 hypothetical protein JCM10914_5638 [Paenibacillus sp. JCM 10914]